MGNDSLNGKESKSRALFTIVSRMHGVPHLPVQDGQEPIKPLLPIDHVLLPGQILVQGPERGAPPLRPVSRRRPVAAALPSLSAGEPVREQAGQLSMPLVAIRSVNGALHTEARQTTRQS